MAEGNLLGLPFTSVPGDLNLGRDPRTNPARLQKAFEPGPAGLQIPDAVITRLRIRYQLLFV